MYNIIKYKVKINEIKENLFMIPKVCKNCDSKINYKCEVQNFLKKFIESNFKKNIYELDFYCPDKSSDNKEIKKPDLEFKIDDKKYVIEAKGLEFGYYYMISHVLECINYSIYNALNDKSKLENILGVRNAKAFIELFEEYGIQIQFFEDIIFATNMIGKMECNDVFLKIILEYMFKSMKVFGKYEERDCFWQSYSIDKNTYQQRKNKSTKLQNLSKFYQENKIEYPNMDKYLNLEKYKHIKIKYIPYNVLLRSTNKEEEEKKSNIYRDNAYSNICKLNESITIGISKGLKPKDMRIVRSNNRILNYEENMLEDYWEKKVLDINGKMEKYDQSYTKILFLNSVSGYLEQELDSKISVIIENIKKYSNIDEIWGEYYENIIINKTVNNIEVLFTENKVYKKFWTRE